MGLSRAGAFLIERAVGRNEPRRRPFRFAPLSDRCRLVARPIADGDELRRAIAGAPARLSCDDHRGIRSAHLHLCHSGITVRKLELPPEVSPSKQPLWKRYKPSRRKAGGNFKAAASVVWCITDVEEISAEVTDSGCARCPAHRKLGTRKTAILPLFCVLVAKNYETHLYLSPGRSFKADAHLLCD